MTSVRKMRTSRAVHIFAIASLCCYVTAQSGYDTPPREAAAAPSNGYENSAPAPSQPRPAQNGGSGYEKAAPEASKPNGGYGASPLAPSKPSEADGAASSAASAGGPGSGSEGVGGFNNEDELARQRSHGARNLKFPLPSCYINDDGFMCCNKELEKVMSDAYKKISTSRPDWKKCNIAQVSVAVQTATQDHFKVPFEVVSGAGDYASKNYFSKDLICKIKRESSYILAFATPQDS